MVLPNAKQYEPATVIDRPQTQTFQFTLGPVQSFVAQARRTRDFWAGSFILSWLSSVAIACIEKQGGSIKFPAPDGAYMRSLYGTASAQDPWPQQGSIPNRFMATTAEVPAGFHPEWVNQAVQDAWAALAQTVWDGDLQGQPGTTRATRAIWERQISSCWEISWVLSDTQAQLNLLDRRKNWRNAVLPQEPGHKCMMMEGWQELSGVEHTNMQEVNRFWEPLRLSGKTGIRSDLGEAEHLCAIAFVKRRFSRYFAQVSVDLPGSLGQVFGWHVPSAVPSVAFLASATWLAQVIDKAPAQAFADFHQAACLLTDHGEVAHVGAGTGAQDAFEIDIRCVAQAAKNASSRGFNRRWAGLDGQVYFESALENHSRTFGANLGAAAQQTARALRNLTQAAGMGKPSPYYAILLMDGDQLGKHMGDQAKHIPISQALNQFTNGAGDIVRAHNGFLIYAGGDDLLALLPLEDALPAAAQLQAMYKDAFAQQSLPGKPIDSTLSGAIEFVHFRTPLTRVLQDAHGLLDGVAKEKTGRNAIAVRVWKPSGLALQWSMPWELALDSEGNAKIAQVAQAFAQQLANEEGAQFSNKFFFRMKTLLERVTAMPQESLEKLLLAEYLHSFGNLSKATKQDLPTLQKHLSGLLAQCWQYRRSEPGKPPEVDAAQPLNPDGAQLVRFLAQKGLDRD